MHYLKYKGESVCVCVFVCLCVWYRDTHHWTNPHQIWHGGLTLQGPGHKLCFGPLGGPRGSGGPKQGLETIYSLNCETRQKVYKTKVVGKRSEARMSRGKNCRYPDPTYHTLRLTYLATFPQIIHFLLYIMTRAMPGNPSKYLIKFGM